MAPAHSDFFRFIKTEFWTFEGPDALRFLNGISTPHLTRQAPAGALVSGRGLFLDPKGKVLAPFVFVKASDQSIRLRLDVGCHTRSESSVELNQSLFDQINGIIIADDVRIHRQSAQVLQCWSADVAAHVSSAPLPAFKPQAQDLLFLAGTYRGNTCLPTPQLGTDAFELWPDSGSEVVQLSGVDNSDEQMAAMFFRAQYLEFPSQLRVGDLPLEFGFADAISFFKGCYRGQEIIARVTYRGKLVKALCELSFEHPVAYGDDQLLGAENQIVGEIRVFSEDRKRALALLRFDVVESAVKTGKGNVSVSSIERLVKETNEHFR